MRSNMSIRGGLVFLLALVVTLSSINAVESKE